VQILLLASALLLPWLTGVLALEYCIRRWPQFGDWHWGTRCCIGLLFGYAALHLLLPLFAQWSQGSRFLLAGFALSSALCIAGVARHPPRPYHAPAYAEALVPGWLKILLCALIALHALTVTAEALSRPVYPWDAWLAWTYRAKAWFYAGGVVPLASTHAWLQDPEPFRYAIDAYNYPRLASILPYWVAATLGYWPETQIGIPALMLAAGVVLGVYGIARETGADRGAALLIAYLLLSLPLLRVHLSLPGYADVWMVGFAGMGMAYLMQGLAARKAVRIVVGFILLAASTQVKHEGMLWLYLGSTLAALLLAPQRWLRLASAVLVGGTALLAVLGGSLDLPLLGRVGIAHGQVWIPGLPAQVLEWHDARVPFLRNALQLDSWHLLWPLLCVLALRSSAQRADRRLRIALVFLLLFALALFIVFFMSAQGRWAATYTAINRVPMQLIPALLLALLWMMLSPRMPDKVPARWRDLAPVVAGAAVAALLTLSQVMLARTAQEADVLPLTNWRTVVGVASTSGRGSHAVTHYQNGVALLSSGPVSVAATALPMLEYRFSGAGAPPDFFWRRSDDPNQLYTHELFADGRRRQPLARLADWQGTITEAGFVLYDTDARQQTLESARIYHPTAMEHLALVLASWREPPLLSQRSINFLSGGSAIKEAYPVSFAGLWLLAALVAALLAGQRQTRLTRTLVITGIGAWLLMDLRWTTFTSVGMLETAGRLASVSAQDHVPATDAANVALAKRVTDSLPDSAQRIVILADLDALAYEALRTKYLLLPHAAIAVPRTSAPDVVTRGDYVLLLHTPGMVTPPPPAPLERDLERVWRDTRATLYRVPKPSRPETA
jgi:hypothetical protein